MATTTYAWSTTLAPFFMTASTSAQPIEPAITANADGSLYLGAWTRPQPGDDVAIYRACDIDGPTIPLSSVAATLPNDQNDVSMAGVANGQFVAVFTDYSSDPGGDIRFRRFTTNGLAASGDTVIDSANAAQDDREADVAGLSGGGFAVTWTRDLGGGNTNVCAAIYNADGTVQNALVDVNSNANNTSFSSVAGIVGGGFVAAWQEEPAAGGDTEVRFRRFNAAGTALDGAAGVLIDTAGSINEDIQVAGLPDGGFVVAYADNGWFGASGTEITVRVYNADGTPRTNFIRANTATGGDQDKPSLTVLSNGYFVVSWNHESSASMFYQAYDANGVAIGTNFNAVDSVIEGEIAALSSGLVASMSTSPLNQFPNDQGTTRSAIHELVRTTTSNAASETLTGDSLRDVMFGGDGDDILDGAGGDDTLLGGVDDDQYFVDSAGDLVVEGAGGGTDHVFASVSYALAAGAEIELLATTDSAGIDPIALTGNGLGQTIEGNDGFNHISGEGGNDTLVGRGGANTLHGGAGIDSAVFAGPRSAYVLTNHGSGGEPLHVTVAGPGSSNSVFTVEKLVFDDVTLNWPQAGGSDFNADAFGDVLFRNTSTGQVATWELNGAGGFGLDNYGAANLAWEQVGTEDFNADGKGDILFRNTSTGQVATWEVNGSGGFSFDSYGNAGLVWQSVGAGDFNADGNGDVLFRNTSTGQVATWELNGTGGFSFDSYGAASLVWKIAGIGDFNEDGKDDILWRNSATGQVATWELDGAGGFAFDSYGAANLTWHVFGVGDFNADGRDDILWRNDSGEVGTWELNGSGGSSFDSYGTTGSQWAIMHATDTNSDGKDDVLWRNTATGQVATWELNGSGGFSFDSYGNAALAWQIFDGNFQFV